ncbi:hypothetical protein GCM10007962_09250 [Yeosuana aromativorans]|uniref:Lipocalin-like domain-containing protein n=1 Tax=Yeosuana aromativorans TaxID=288019 RepID=A0A8J3FI39_9FLAO|nr:hypothetical protein [Yeosuana aromativorans]GGK17162.1 hypothetical protein GCM10007962_09250 [Yeosuana aromativorans]
MKNTFLIIFIFGFLCCYAQKKSELIIGTWKYEKGIDLRTLEEKMSDENKEPLIIESDEKSDTFLTFNKEYIYYNKKEFGQWKIIKDSLLVYRKISKDKEHLDKKIRDEYLKDEFLVLKKDGIYLSKPYYLKIKKLVKETLEFGNEKRYSIYKRFK